MLSVVFLTLAVLVAIFAYGLAPDNSENANQMHLSIHSKAPGFTVKMLVLPAGLEKQKGFYTFFFGNENATTEIPISDYSVLQNGISISQYTEDGSGLTKDFSLDRFPNLAASSQIPTRYIKEQTFLLGTDKYGRDLLSRMLIGIRISLAIGFVAVFISLIIGVSLGAVAGYFGGKVDAIIMWIINVTWSIPTLLLVIAITLALGKGFWQVFIAVGLTMWVEVARVVRGQVMSVKQMQYVTAARALGFTDYRIITKHILPNIMAPVIIISAANFAGAILIFCVPPPTNKITKKIWKKQRWPSEKKSHEHPYCSNVYMCTCAQGQRNHSLNAIIIFTICISFTIQNTRHIIFCLGRWYNIIGLIFQIGGG